MCCCVLSPLSNKSTVHPRWWRKEKDPNLLSLLLTDGCIHRPPPPAAKEKEDGPRQCNKMQGRGLGRLKNLVFFFPSFLPLLSFFFMGRRQRRQRNSEVPSVKSYSRNFWSFLGRIVWVFIGCIRLQYKVGLSLESLFLISSAASPSKTLHISRGTEQKMSIVWKRFSYFDAIPRWAKTNSDRFVFYALNLTVWYL